VTSGPRSAALGLVMIGVGIIGGTWSSPSAPPEPLRRGRYHVLTADLHTHTRYSDGFLSPFELVFSARRRGLDVIAVTEHNQVFPAKIARMVARRMDAPAVIVGEEITSRDYHLLAYGIERAVVPRADLGAVLEDVRRQGGVAIAAHPVRRFWPAFRPVRAELHGAEVVHPVAFLPERGDGGFRWSEMVAFYREGWDEDGDGLGRQDLTAVGSSDFHFFALLGTVSTHVFLDEVPAEHDARAAATVEALRQRRTVVRAPDGTLFGAPDLVALVRDEPLPPPPPSPYPARSILDFVTRLCGFLGALYLLLATTSARRPNA
jgi:hypothetical protein